MPYCSTSTGWKAGIRVAETGLATRFPPPTGYFCVASNARVREATRTVQRFTRALTWALSCSTKARHSDHGSIVAQWLSDLLPAKRRAFQPYCTLSQDGCKQAVPRLTYSTAHNLSCMHTFTIPRVPGRAGLVAAADRALPGPLHERGVGVSLELHRHRIGSAGAVMHLRGRRQHLAVCMPGPLLRCIVPGAPLSAFLSCSVWQILSLT